MVELVDAIFFGGSEQTTMLMVGSQGVVVLHLGREELLPAHCAAARLSAVVVFTRRNLIEDVVNSLIN